jgi:hypothetical protein
MPSHRNPSFTLSDAQVDDIVDRLLLGKYEKYRPVSALDVVRAGLMGQTTCRDYVTARWGERGRWERSSGDKNGRLSAAGITMRSNKLWERCSNHVTAVKNSDNDELVWRVYDNRSYDTVCYAVGSSSSARQWAWTLFGWTLPEGTTIERLRVELHGGGGIIAASSMNMTLAGRSSERVKALRDEAARKLAEAERLENAIASVTAAAAHLAGGSGATG